MLEHDIQDRAAGRISSEEYWDRVTARGVGALVGMGLLFGGAEAAAFARAGLGATAIPGLAQFFSNPNATERGRQIEQALAARFGGGLPGTFPTIDRFANGVATSVKSLDLGLRTYQNIGALTSRLTGFVNDLVAFTGKAQASPVVGRALELVVPQGATAQQIEAIRKVADYAKDVGVTFKIFLAR